MIKVVLKKIKNSKRIKIISGIVLILLISIICTTKYYSVPKIDRVLSSSDYNYLPPEAQNYIKEVYEKTGEIILTEKNKKENVPYLNPDFVEYIILSDEKKSDVALIPDVYSLDYIYNEKTKDKNLPSKFDLSNINNESYITPLKDQNPLGVCWAFAAVEQAESYLMVKNETPYNNLTEKFSIRQMDYATSINGISHYTNEYGYRVLGDGGNFYISSDIMSHGLSLVDDKIMPYNGDLSKKSLAEVFNYNNSKYEVNNTVEFPNIETAIIFDPDYSCDEESDEFACYNEYVSELKTTYLNEIKNNIMEYGGAIVSTISPQSNCGFQNKDGKYVLSVNEVCYSTGLGHAMHVIGWDDDYEYNYCDIGGTNENYTTCSSQDVMTGRGAFLVRNSWGESEYDYIYLTYDSIYDGIGSATFDFSTNISSMNNRTWDNSYKNNSNYNDEYVNIATYISQDFKKTISGKEKIEKVKFRTIAQNGTYTLSIYTNEDSYSEIAEVTVPYPGIYTIDLSKENIIIDDSDFSVYLYSNNNAYMIDQSISVFTSNIEKDPVIVTEDIIVEDKYNASEQTDYIIDIYSKTKNIASGETIEYSLLFGEDDVTDKFEVVNDLSDNDIPNGIVAKNDVNSIAVIDKSAIPGEYTLITKYNGYEFSSTLTLGEIINVQGQGTIDSPYLIHNENELAMMNEYKDAHYKLANDIEFTKEWNPVGDYNDPFTGSLDGSGYTLKDLYVENYDSLGGLFGYIEIDTNTDYVVKDLTIKDANVYSDNSAGILAGAMTCNKKCTINNVYIMDGYVFSWYNTGSLIGELDISSFGTHINNIFSSASIEGFINNGLIGIVINDYNQANNLYLNNIMNVGNIYTPYYEGFSNYASKNIPINETRDVDSAYSGLIIGNVYYSYPNMDNIIVTGNIYDSENDISNALIGSSESDGSINYATIQNGYFVHEDSPYQSIYSSYPEHISKIKKKSIVELKNESLYSEWTNFKDNWVIEEKDGIKRIPVLKGVEFEYTKIEDITLNVDEYVNLYDYLTPNTDAAQNIHYEIEDETIIEIDEYMDVYGLKVGETKVHVISDYDGYERDVIVKVNPDLNPEVYFIANNGTDEYKVQVTELEDFVLNKNEFTYEGYTFKEWNTEYDGSGISYADNSLMEAITADLMLYAIWEPISYSIVYDYNGLRDNIVENVKYDEIITIIQNEFNYQGYIFKEWNTNIDGTGESYVPGNDVYNLTSVDGEVVTLYAIWEREKGTIKFDSNGGKGTMEDMKVSLEENANLIQNEFTKTGYKFHSWNTKIDGTGTSYNDLGIIKLDIVQELTLYAQWTPISYKIRFDNNYALGYMSDIDVKYDEIVTLPENGYTYSGYTFIEYNTKSDGSGTSYKPGDKINNLTTKDNEIVILYAIWKGNHTKVTFNSNGGSGAMDDMFVTIGERFELSSNEFTRTGYNFYSWNTEPDGTGTKYNNRQNITLNNEESLTLYAMWTPINYEVIFFSNNGQGLEGRQVMVYDDEFELMELTFDYLGYTFKEWNTKPDGTGTSYSNGQIVKNLASNADEVVALYAIWVENYEYVISNYRVDEVNRYIDLIPLNTTYDNYIKNFDFNYNYSLSLEWSNNEYIGTGRVTNILKNGNYYKQYINIVRGDINGDGKASSLDYVKVKNHIMKTNIIRDNVYLTAADANEDNKISSLDYVRIKNIIMKGAK